MKIWKFNWFLVKMSKIVSRLLGLETISEKAYNQVGSASVCGVLCLTICVREDELCVGHGHFRSNV